MINGDRFAVRIESSLLHRQMDEMGNEVVKVASSELPSPAQKLVILFRSAFGCICNDTATGCMMSPIFRVSDEPVHPVLKLRSGSRPRIDMEEREA
jgi:hypothetical protein